jgi:hypothetical protein
MPEETKYSEDNPFVERKYSEDNPFAKPQGIPLTALAGESFLDSFAAVPSGIGDALAFGAGGLEGLIAGPFSERGFDFGGRIEEQQEKFPANVIRSIPRPTTAGAISAARSLPALMPGGETFTESFGGEMADLDAARMITQRENPFLSDVARLGGQGLAIASGRLPLLNRINKAEDAIMAIRKAPEIEFSIAQLARSPVTIRDAVWNSIKNSKALRGALRGTGRAAEAGLEATVLDIINNGTPGETFGYAAGLQLANSGLLSSAKALSGAGKSPTVKLNRMTLALVIGATAISQFQNVTPLDDDFGHALTESSRHITLGLALGAISGLVGGGRFRGSTDDMSRTAQGLIDAVTAVPRATTTGMMRQYQESDPAGQEAMNALMQGVLMNPGGINNRDLARIESSIENGTFEDTAIVMMRDNRFTERLFAEPKKTQQINPAAFSGLTFEKPTR